MSLSDQELDRRLQALDRSCEPPERVWRQLQHELDTRPSRRRSNLPWMAMAAAVSGLAVSSALWLLPVGSPPDSAQVELQSPQTMPTVVEEAVVGLQRSRQAVAAASAENEAAIRKLEAALEREPGNLLLMEFLAEARFRQAELVSTAVRLDVETNTP
ncbi:MAG: hypothetical protein ACXIUL_07830 [Wenzhouxiangella sp.]